MAELNKIRLLLFVSLVICPTLVFAGPSKPSKRLKLSTPPTSPTPSTSPTPLTFAKPLYLSLSAFFRHFFCHDSKIIWDDSSQQFIRTYIGRDIEKNYVYTARPNTTKVIVYIMNFRDSVDITGRKNEAKRIEIHDKLREHNYELLYLGAVNYVPGDEKPIGQFIFETIRPHKEPSIVETIGRRVLDVDYVNASGEPFKKYKEDSAVCGGDLRALLHSFAVRSDECSSENEEQQ